MIVEGKPALEILRQLVGREVPVDEKLESIAEECTRMILDELEKSDIKTTEGFRRALHEWFRLVVYMTDLQLREKLTGSK